MKKHNGYGWYVVAINAVIGCTMSAGFPQSSMTAAALAEAMGVAQDAVLVGDTVKTVGIVLAMMLSGIAYRKLGLRPTFLISMAAVVLTTAVIPHNRSLTLLYILKFIQGFSSLIFPLFLIVIMDWIGEKDRGLSSAIYTGVFYGGAGVGGTFSGFVIEKFGWQASFYALALVQAAMAAVWLFTVRENGERTSQEAKLSLGVVLKNPLVWFLVASFIATTWSVQAISVDMPLFGADLGYRDLENGKVMSAISVGIILSCLVSGKLSDLWAAGRRNKAAARTLVFAVGCVIIAAAVAALLVLDLTQFAVFYGVVLFFSFGAAWGLGTFYCILPELFDEETSAVATGLIGGFGDIGMTLGPVGVGILCGARGLWALGWGLCAIVAAVSLLACIGIIGMTKKLISKGVKEHEQIFECGHHPDAGKPGHGGKPPVH